MAIRREHGRRRSVRMISTGLTSDCENKHTMSFSPELLISRKNDAQRANQSKRIGGMWWRCKESLHIGRREYIGKTGCRKEPDIHAPRCSSESTEISRIGKR